MLSLPKGGKGKAIEKLLNFFDYKKASTAKVFAAKTETVVFWGFLVTR
jgi:hypothetical protein